MTYFGAERSLLVKMPGQVHETVEVAVTDHFKVQATQMGLMRRELQRIGSSQYASIHPDGGAAEPDDGLKPSEFRPGPDDFPTLVVEVARSQDINQAHKAKDWWFNHSSPDHERGGVGAVFIVKVVSDELGTLIAELWSRRAKRPKKATIQLKDPNRYPDQDQVNDNPDLWTWSGLPMRVAFEDLVLRPKAGLEHDFDVTSDMMVDAATSAWNYRGAAPRRWSLARQRADEELRRRQQREQEEAKKRHDAERDKRAEQRRAKLPAN